MFFFFPKFVFEKYVFIHRLCYKPGVKHSTVKRYDVKVFLWFGMNYVKSIENSGEKIKVILDPDTGF